MDSTFRTEVPTILGKPLQGMRSELPPKPGASGQQRTCARVTRTRKPPGVSPALPPATAGDRPQPILPAVKTKSSVGPTYKLICLLVPRWAIFIISQNIPFCLPLKFFHVFFLSKVFPWVSASYI